VDYITFNLIQNSKLKIQHYLTPCQPRVDYFLAWSFRSCCTR